MIKRILFIYPQPANNYSFKGRFPEGIGYLSAVLKKNNYSTRLLKIIDYYNNAQFQNCIDSFKPDIIAISATTNSFQIIKDHLVKIKKISNAFVILGGVHPTLNPDICIKYEGIDAICLGEGETALLKLCDSINKNRDYTKIKSLWVKQQNSIIKNPVNLLTENLDKLPDADRSIYDYSPSEEKNSSYIVVSAGRGCPFNCNYCCNGSIKKLYTNENKYVRMRSVDRLINELVELKYNHNWVRFYIFDDDIFTLDQKWLEEFAGAYKKKVNIPYICNAQVKTITDDKIKILKDSGCMRINLGIESGNFYIRKNILNKHFSDEQLITATELIKKYGIELYTFNMIGIPDENAENAAQTIEINAKVDSDINQVTFFYPYRGTPAFAMCRDRNIYVDEASSYVFRPVIDNNYDSRFVLYNFSKLVELRKKNRITYDNLIKLIMNPDSTEFDFKMPYIESENAKKICIIRSSRREHFIFILRKLKESRPEVDFSVLLTPEMPEEANIRNLKLETNDINYSKKYLEKFNFEQFESVYILINNFEMKGYDTIINLLKSERKSINLAGILPNGWMVAL